MSAATAAAWARLARAQRAEATGDVAAWVDLATVATDAEFGASSVDDDFPVFWLVAMAAALAGGDEALIRRLWSLVDEAPRGLVPTYLEAQRLRFQALLAARGGDAPFTGDGDVDAMFGAAARALDDFGAPYWSARVRVEHAEWLEAQGRDAEAGPLLERADELFDGLGARPWRERCRRPERSAIA